MTEERIAERWYLLFGGPHGGYVGRTLAYERAVAHLQAPPANVIYPAAVVVLTDRSSRRCYAAEELIAPPPEGAPDGP